ncbi:hypothetical protein ACFSKM_21820 [Ancylobacter dichloromethanicus]
MTGIDSIFKGSAYLIGATTGVALMVPLTAGALATGSMTRLAPHPVAIEAFGPGAAARHPVVRAPMVNRAAKGPRLDLAPRDAASSTVGSPAASSLAPAPVRPTVSPAAVTPQRGEHRARDGSGGARPRHTDAEGLPVRHRRHQIQPFHRGTDCLRRRRLDD